MAPKKKDGEKKVKRKKKLLVHTPFVYEPPHVSQLIGKPSVFVRCKICCTALPHLNFEWPAVPTELTLAAVKDAIVKRHGGGLTSLTLYKNVVHPDHSLANAPDGASLKDLGIEGALMGGGGEVASLPAITILYDFAAGSSDPIVCVEPSALESKHDLPMKLYRKLTSPNARQQAAAAAAPSTPPAPLTLGRGGGAR